MSALSSLGRFVATLSPADLPAPTRRAAQLQVLNILAAALLARGSREYEAVRRGLLGLDGKDGSATVLTSNQRASITTAAAINAAASMTHDFDDILWMGHTGHSAVFAALAVAEHEAASSADFLTAVVAANEVAGRLGASSVLGPVNGQMVTFIHAIGAAAAGAKLLGLDAERSTHAMAISLAQPNLALQPAFMRSSSKLLSASVPLVTGLLAAYAAREGVTGHPDLLEDERGFWRHFAFAPMPHMMEELGELWVTDTLQMKTYPGCHYFQTACTALEQALDGKPARLDEIDRIEVCTTKLGFEATHFGETYGGGALDPVNVNFDLKSTLALLLHAGRLTVRELDADWLEREASSIHAWRDRIGVRHDPALTLAVLRAGGRLGAGRRALSQLTLKRWRKLAAHYRETYASTLMHPRDALGWLRALARSKQPASSKKQLAFPNRLTVCFSDGRRRNVQVDIPVADCQAEGVEEALLAKLTAALGPEHASILKTHGLQLDHAPLASLIDLATVGSTCPEPSPSPKRAPDPESAASANQPARPTTGRASAGASSRTTTP